MTETLKYSKDGVVAFNPTNHTYTNVVTGKNLISVTTLLKKLKTPFDSETLIPRKAEEIGISNEKVSEMWEAIADFGRKQGDYVHKMFENAHYNLEYNTHMAYPKSYIALGAIAKYFKSGLMESKESEYIVYNEHIAGQIDNISLSKKGLFIIDFKQNKEIDRNNYGKFFKGTNIPESTYHEYCLQLSIYKYLLKDMDIKGLFILHIGDKKHEFIKAIDYSDMAEEIILKNI